MSLPALKLKSTKIKCICKNCEKEFHLTDGQFKHHAAKFCSRVCDLHYRKQGSNIVKLVCRYCKKDFQKYPSTIKQGKGKFCSKKCHNEHMRSPEVIESLFWSNVIKTDLCWLFNKVPSARTYCRVQLGKNKQKMAHRYSYELHFGEIPDGLFVCHKCDNRRCIRPDHLFLGTQKDNMQDMVKKGRHRSQKRNLEWMTITRKRN
jgi:HNH endonuclease